MTRLSFTSYDGLRAPGRDRRRPADRKRGSHVNAQEQYDVPLTGGSELVSRDLEILAFERQWWKYAGAKEQAIR